MKILKKTWLNPKIKIRESAGKGKGMFADNDIDEGDKVLIWGGNYVDRSGADKAKKEGKLVLQWDKDLFSVEDRGDEDGYFINHSCDSNTWMTDSFTLVARRDIKKGEEITADYALWELDESYMSKWNCVCKSPFCRGKITGKDWKIIDLQKRYKHHFLPLINEKIENNVHI